MSEPQVKHVPIVIGWEEWLALPDLGLPAIRAKIDTGAKTSALHAFAIEPFGSTTAPQVRFGVHPVPGREDIVRHCTAALADRREVTSSNGDKEVRFVIRTRLQLAGEDRGWIEATLTNRESMAYRMLLGRQAIRGGMLVDPNASFLLPRLSHRLYTGLPQPTERHRPLRIALVATRPERATNRLLVEEAASRDHRLDILPLDRLHLDFDTDVPRLLVEGALAARYDAVLARATGGPSGFAAAVVRHVSQSGAVALVGADAMERLRSPYRLATALHAEGLPTRLAEPDQPSVRCLVIDGKVEATSGRVADEVRHFAVRIAAALELGLVAIDVTSDGPASQLAGVDINPALSGYRRSRMLAGAIIAALERRLAAPAILAHGD